MAPITEQMLRSRAEHNEGCLGTLEEVALHQQEIERLEALGQMCRNLKILYIQNNLIGKLENLHRLKGLEYLNIALNNITKIENLQRCESLNKLDMTVNFVDKAGLLSVASLQANYSLTELYLTGNPCTEFEGYRKYVIATLPTLQKLDGTKVTPSERIVAKQEIAEISSRLERELEEEGIDVEAAKQVEVAPELEGDVPGAYFNEKGEIVRPWCPQTRILEHRETAAQREESDAMKKANNDKLVLDGSRGSHRQKPRHETFPEIVEGERFFQKNEGKFDYTLAESDDGRALVLDVAVGKYMDTSLIDADVQPTYVRVMVKGRLLQLELLEEVEPDNSTAQRSTLTGHLVVTMPKVNPGEVRAPTEISAPAALKKFTGRNGTSAAANGGGVAGGGGKGELKPVKGGVKALLGGEDQDVVIREVKPAAAASAAGDDWEDDDDVPPLE